MADLPPQLAGYRPSQATLDHIRKVTLVAVIGPSGVGKTTLMEQAAKRALDLHMVVGTTSRSARPDEQHGHEYWFQNESEVLARLREQAYVQIEQHVTGDFYATAPEDYTADGVNLFAVLASAMPRFHALPFKILRTVCVLPPDIATWRERMQLHQFTATQKGRRMIEARESLAFMVDTPEIQFVINDQLEQSLVSFMALARDESLDLELQTQQTRGRELAFRLLQSVDQL